MRLEQLTTIHSVRHILDGTQAVAFSVATRKQERSLGAENTGEASIFAPQQGRQRRDNALLDESHGHSLAQIKRLIQQYATTGLVVVKQTRSNGFKKTYTDADVRLLAQMDELHEQPSGAVLKSSVNVPICSLGKNNTSDLPPSQSLTCITYALLKLIKGSGAF